MKVKYKTTIYNRSNPFGKEKICISEGMQVEKPSYLMGCGNCIFLKNDRGIIAIIEKENIIKVY